jgi:hypothetical protein
MGYTLKGLYTQFGLYTESYHDSLHMPINLADG